MRGLKKLKRDNEIREHLANGAGGDEVAKKYGISRVLVYKIGSMKPKFCEQHKVNYYHNCMDCTQYRKLHKKLETFNVILAKDPVLQKLVEISKADSQRKHFVEARTHTIQVLRNRFHLSYPQIGQVINMSHSGVRHHYEKA